MGWLGISFLIVLVALGITYYFDKKRTSIKLWHKTEDYMVCFFVTSFFALVLVGLLGGLYTGTSEGYVHKGDTSACTKSINSWDIVSAVRDQSVKGSFILGTGGVSRVDTYYVYQVEDEGLLLTDFNAHRTFVVEQDGRPRYERIDWICPKPIADFLWWSNGHVKHNYNREGTLYVPKGTILREFRM